MSKKHLGSSIDDFLEEEGILEEAQAQAIKEVVAWQLAEAMQDRGISKARLARMLRTSRSQLDRILDPRHDVMLSSLQRAAALVGRRVTIGLVAPAPAARSFSPPAAEPGECRRKAGRATKCRAAAR